MNRERFVLALIAVVGMAMIMVLGGFVHAQEIETPVAVTLPTPTKSPEVVPIILPTPMPVPTPEPTPELVYQADKSLHSVAEEQAAAAGYRIVGENPLRIIPINPTDPRDIELAKKYGY